MKLAQIPKQHQPATKVVQEEQQPTLPLAEDFAVDQPDDQDENIYGLDASSPDYAKMQKRLKILKRSDPTLYRKITGLS